jgi:hypothetical protein
MEEILPEHWLFPEGDGNQMNICINDVLNKDQQEYIEKNREIIVSRLNLDFYKESFKNNVMQVVETLF